MMDFNFTDLLAAGHLPDDSLLGHQDQRHRQTPVADALHTGGQDMLKGHDPLMSAPAALLAPAPPLPAIVPTIGDPGLEDPAVGVGPCSVTENMLRHARGGMIKSEELAGMGSALKRSVEEAFGNDAGPDPRIADDVVPEAAGRSCGRPKRSPSKAAAGSAGPAVKPEPDGNSGEGSESQTVAAPEPQGQRRSRRVATSGAVRQSSRTRTMPKRLIDTYTMEDADAANAQAEESTAESEGEEAEVVDKVSVCRGGWKSPLSSRTRFDVSSAAHACHHDGTFPGRR